MNRGLIYAIVAIVAVGIGLAFFRVYLPEISVAAEPIPAKDSPITNALLTSWIVIVFIAIGAYLGTRNMQLIPSGFQNLLEASFEALYNLTESISGSDYVKKFYLIPMSIFFYVLISNWFGLLPFVPAVGFCQADREPKEEQVIQTVWPKPCEEGYHLVPLFRSPSADLNNTLMLALFTQVAAQVYGFAVLGFGGYLKKYFVFGGILAAFKPDEHGNPRSFSGAVGQFLLGLIDMAVGLLELLGEFNKVIAYTFRLFGNIFAGEVMLLVLTFLIPVGLTVVFVGFEIFVGLIQAFVFFVLSVAFYTVAVTPPHGDEAH